MWGSGGSWGEVEGMKANTVGPVGVALVVSMKPVTGALQARATSPDFFLLPKIPTREKGLWRPPFFLPLFSTGGFVVQQKNPYEELAVNQESQACLTSATYVLSSSGQL